MIPKRAALIPSPSVPETPPSVPSFLESSHSPAQNTSAGDPAGVVRRCHRLTSSRPSSAGQAAAHLLFRRLPATNSRGRTRASPFLHTAKQITLNSAIRIRAEWHCRVPLSNVRAAVVVSCVDGAGRWREHGGGPDRERGRAGRFVVSCRRQSEELVLWREASLIYLATTVLRPSFGPSLQGRSRRASYVLILPNSTRFHQRLSAGVGAVPTRAGAAVCRSAQ